MAAFIQKLFKSRKTTEATPKQRKATQPEPVEQEDTGLTGGKNSSKHWRAHHPRMSWPSLPLRALPRISGSPLQAD